jgi:hypothetical protein
MKLRNLLYFFKIAINNDISIIGDVAFISLLPYGGSST